MSGVKALAFALFVAAVQAASQDGSQVFSNTAPPGWKTNQSAVFAVGQAARAEVFQMFPYPVPADGPSGPQMQAQCKFSDGKAITVDYSTRHVKVHVPLFGDGWQTVFNDIKFVTDESLVTVKRLSVPAGDYTIAVPERSPMVFPILFMKRHTGGEFSMPMSVTKLASPAENSAISFEHTGGSCMMQVSEKNWSTQFSVEFRERNADLPVAN
jgi:hypothetical protein